MTLQNASYWVSFSGRYGTWGFLPVTDGTFVQQLPTQQLLKKQVNGVNMLIGVRRPHLFSAWSLTNQDQEQRQRRLLLHSPEYRDRGRLCQFCQAKFPQVFRE